MKRVISIFLLALILPLFAKSDIIPEDYHLFERCIKITNPNEFENVSIVGYVVEINGDNYAYKVESDECLSKGYKFNYFKLFAVNSDYISDKKLNNIDFPNDPHSIKSNIIIDPVKGFCHDSISISRINSFYKILGFTDSTFVLFKWKEVKEFSDGTPDTVVLFENQTDSDQYKKTLTIERKSPLNSKIDIYPNPARESFQFVINNNYIGKFQVVVTNFTNTPIFQEEYLKLSNETLFSRTISFCDINIANGIYFIRFTFGEFTQSKKIILHQ